MLNIMLIKHNMLVGDGCVGRWANETQNYWQEHQALVDTEDEHSKENLQI